MKLNSLIKGMVLSIPFLLASCSNEEQAMVDNKCRVVCSVDKFESESLSRTNTDPENGFLITWASGDVIGIFPREGYQEPFEIPADQVGNKSASFDGGYWDVKDGLQYNAYYPFDKRNFDSADMKTKIPVTYVGQKQNGTSCDIGAFDYTYSDWGTAVDGKIGFDFHHIGAISVFSLKYPATTTYTRMTLSVDDALIPLEGSYDLTAEEVSFVANESSMAESITLTLENCSGVAGETGVFYMMLPPMMDLSNNVVTLSLTSAAGTICTYSIDKALNTKSGKLYRRTGVPMDSKVEGTVDGWVEDEEDEIPYITFTAEATQSLSMSKAVETLEYSVNGGEWKTLGTTTVAFGGDNGDLRLRGKSIKGTKVGDSSYHFDYNSSTIIFGNSGLVSCVGDIRTLLDYDDYINVPTQYATFSYLFNNCYQLISAPLLPATSLADGCYFKMFTGCRNLASAPSLPAISLTESCYEYMFSGCKGLTSAPELPATTLASRCYYGMFKSCEGLTSAPSLPATTLEDWCYYSMFYNCNNLVSAPSLPATILADYCYFYMFSGCSKLSTAPSLPASVLKDGCYKYMFSGCTILTSTPVLSVSTLAKECYAGMFSDCVNLTSAPSLPALILAKGCYEFMFSGCAKLVSVPVLSATVLAESCYAGMFSSCNSLTIAPSLSATTLAPNCYAGMFANCINLSEAPALPAIQLANGCYGSQSYGGGMFEGCISLTEAPMLPAATLVDNCYYNMFLDCKNLNIVKMLATDVTATGCLKNWLSGVSSTGTFTKAKEMTSLPTGSNGIPSGWTVKNYGEDEDTTPYLTFTAAQTENFRMMDYVENLEYSVDGGEWATLGTTSVTFGGSNGNLRLRGKNRLGTDGSSIWFGNNVLVACSGDIRTLVDYENYRTVDTSQAMFSYLFYGCTNLTSGPELPSETLAPYCYCNMFEGCTNLISAPELPAKTLAPYCYYNMFNGCTSLTSAPKLSAVTLAEGCCEKMFASCYSLSSAPELPATTLAKGCYKSMFFQCFSLVSAPELPAKELVRDCYSCMFIYCNKLNSVTMLATDISASSCLDSWLFLTSTIGTFTKAKEMASLPSGENGIPSGWTVVDYEE